MNFNAPYYQELFENYGFKMFFEQICFGMDPKKPFSKKLMDRHAIVAADPAYRAAHISINEILTAMQDILQKYTIKPGRVTGE